MFSVMLLRNKKIEIIMFTKRELKIITNIIATGYILALGPTFIFDFTKIDDFFNNFFLIANSISILMLIITDILITTEKIRSKILYLMLGIIVIIAIAELLYPGLSLVERCQNWFAMGNIVLSIILAKIYSKIIKKS